MPELKEQGVRSSVDLADDRFLRFNEIVQSAAREQGCVFFIESEEGNEIETDELSGGDLAGWLIEFADVAAFTPQWSVGCNAEISDVFDNRFCFSKWSADTGEIEIEFVFIQNANHQQSLASKPSYGAAFLLP